MFPAAVSLVKISVKEDRDEPGTTVIIEGKPHIACIRDSGKWVRLIRLIIGTKKVLMSIKTLG